MQDPRGAALSGASRSAQVLLLVVAALAVLADLGTKVLVVARLEGQTPIELGGGLVTLVVSRNSGAAFSFAQGATLAFTAIAIIVVTVIVRTLPRLRARGWAVALGLLLGGALGNLLDRIFRAPGVGRGAVVDFLSVPHFASFNVADSAITMGAALAVLLSLRRTELDGTRRKAE